MEESDAFVLVHIYQNCIHFQAVHSLGAEAMTLAFFAQPIELQ